MGRKKMPQSDASCSSCKLPGRRAGLGWIRARTRALPYLTRSRRLGLFGRVPESSRVPVVCTTCKAERLHPRQGRGAAVFQDGR